MTAIIATGGGWRRVYRGRPEGLRAAMYRIGCAEITAATTVLPAYREIIDTLRWEDMR